MRLGLRSSGLFLDCWLLLNVLSVHVGVQVDGLLVSRYNLICRGGCLSYMYSSRRLSSTDSNCNRKRELVSITAKKGERIEDSTGGNSGRNKVIRFVGSHIRIFFLLKPPHHFLTTTVSCHTCSLHFGVSLCLPPAQHPCQLVAFSPTYIYGVLPFWMSYQSDFVSLF